MVAKMGQQMLLIMAEVAAVEPVFQEAMDSMLTVVGSRAAPAAAGCRLLLQELLCSEPVAVVARHGTVHLPLAQRAATVAAAWVLFAG